MNTTWTYPTPSPTTDLILSAEDPELVSLYVNYNKRSVAAAAIRNTDAKEFAEKLLEVAGVAATISPEVDPKGLEVVREGKMLRVAGRYLTTGGVVDRVSNKDHLIRTLEHIEKKHAAMVLDSANYIACYKAAIMFVEQEEKAEKEEAEQKALEVLRKHTDRLNALAKQFGYMMTVEYLPKNTVALLEAIDLRNQEIAELTNKKDD